MECLRSSLGKRDRTYIMLKGKVRHEFLVVTNFVYRQRKCQEKANLMNCFLFLNYFYCFVLVTRLLRLARQYATISYNV